VAIPKETAEVICQSITSVTGCKVDWHYIGGRVHIKALVPPASVVTGELLEAMDEVIRISDRDHDAWNRAKEAIAACRAAMLAQPVSQGYKLSSPETPEGWISCEDRMPEDGDVVLVSQEGGIIYCAEVEGGVLYPDEFPRVPTQGKEITHWMPLPAAPKQGEKQ
jgi:hypothetical protein